MKNCKYIAIKVNDLNHWLWFETEKVTEENDRFIGLGGWGEDGCYTEINVDITEIIGRIHSDNLQYN